jgi:hypothetical protein
MHEHKEPRTEGLSLISLIIGSVSSAAAAVVVHELWRPGTILGAAVTPVLMALFAEALRRPAERVTVPSSRVFERRTPRSQPRWTSAVLTGLAAFLLGAAGLTASELLMHRSVADGGHRTTLFDRRPQHPSAVSTQSTPTPRPERPASEASREERRPRQTPTPTASPTTTPTPAGGPTQPPGQAEPAPTPGDLQPTPTPTPSAAPQPITSEPSQPLTGVNYESDLTTRS